MNPHRQDADQGENKATGAHSCWVCGRFIRAGEAHDCKGPRKPRPKYAPRTRQKAPSRPVGPKQVLSDLSPEQMSYRSAERVRGPP